MKGCERGMCPIFRNRRNLNHWSGRHIICGLMALWVISSLLPGCNAVFSSGEPPVGRECTVQFRRDALGASADLPISPTANVINGVSTSVFGRILSQTPEWIALEVMDSKIRHTYYVPRSQILLIECREDADDGVN